MEQYIFLGALHKYKILLYLCLYFLMIDVHYSFTMLSQEGGVADFCLSY